jgi:hypothetical protein
MGEAHSYFADCVYFEPTHVRCEGENAPLEFSQPAIGLFQNCHLNTVHPQVMSVQSELCMSIAADDPKVDWMFRPCYMRVGYCPVQFLGDYAVAVTFLRVGFRKTREYTILKAASLPRQKKRRFLQLAWQESHANEFNQDAIELLRWLHRNAVPQVVSLDQVVFADEPVGGILDSPYAKVNDFRGRVLNMLIPKRDN